MMRSASRSNGVLKRKTITDVWSEEEHDFLWIGVRRHTQGNWDAMLRDSKLIFSKCKTAKDLSARWEDELQKMMDGSTLPVPKPTKPTKRTKTSLMPPLSNETMARALQGSKFGGLLKSQAHQTEMEMGLVHPASGLTHAGPADRSGARSLGKFSSLLNQFVNIAHGSHNNMGSGDPKSSELLLDFNEGLHIPSLKGKEVPDFEQELKISDLRGKEVAAGGSLSTNKLPHWLWEAVCAYARSMDPEQCRQFPPVAQSAVTASGLPWIESNPDLNVTNPSSSSISLNLQKKTSTGLSPSPEVLQFVASHAAPDPLPGQKLEQADSEDSIKTISDPPLPDFEEISSQGTVSDHHSSDREIWAQHSMDW